MADLVVHPATKPLEGSVKVPSDKSIGHRALLLAGIARGRSRIREFSYGGDNVSTANCLRALGVNIQDVSPTVIEVDGVGLFGLKPADAALDCGNSGTTMRLLTGLLCPQPFKSILIGDHTLMRRPMMRIARPLRARGATIEGQPHPVHQNEITAPLHVGPQPPKKYLGPLEYNSKVSSAQVKSAVLLSGLYAHGPTHFNEPLVSRDHTERMLLAQGVPLRTVGTIVQLDPLGWSGEIAPLDVEVPGDLSAAAFLLVAAQMVPGSKIKVSGVGVNPTRTGLLDVLRDMGAGIGHEPKGDQSGEPVADLLAWSDGRTLTATTIAGELVPRAIDEMPIACALAARANGTTAIADAEELRVKESDRIATMAVVLRAFGVQCQESPDGIIIEGRGTPLEPAVVESKGDHRIAMTACVLALVAKGPTRVRDVACIATSFPKFVRTMRALGVQIDVEN